MKRAANHYPKRNQPPKGEAWIWQTLKMLESPAHRALGINARRVLDFLMIEWMHHGGTENGRLLAPYNQLTAFGLPKSEIRRAIDELEAFGFIDVLKGKRLCGQAQASRYGLTWFSTAEGEPANNRWKRITEMTVREYRTTRSRLDGIKRERKRSGKKLIAVDGGKCGRGTEILKAVRKPAPGFVPKVEPKNASIGSESRTEDVRNVGA